MRKELVAVPVALAVLVLLIVAARTQIEVTWRLVPVQQSVILPPALGAILLSPGDTLTQRFTLPADAGGLVSDSGFLTLDFVSIQGKVAPDVHTTLHGPGNRLLGTWLLPSALVTRHTVMIPISDLQGGSGGTYSLDMQVPLATSAGAAPGAVNVAYAPADHPSGSSLLVSGRPYPGTLGLTISHAVSAESYLAHYATMLLAGRTAGSTIPLGLAHLLWLVAIVSIGVTGTTLVGWSLRLPSASPIEPGLGAPRNTKPVYPAKGSNRKPQSRKAAGSRPVESRRRR